jgi:hypothetical protein
MRIRRSAHPDFWRLPVWPDWREGSKEAVLFEKKKQKTFVSWACAAG